MTKKNIFDLGQRVFVVTGGAGYLGMKHSEAILESNGRVALFDISSSVIEKALNLNSQFEGRVFGYEVDITNEKMIEEAVERVKQDLGPVYGLVNNAANNPKMREGNSSNDSRVESFPLERWEKDLSVGITGAFIMSKVLGRQMVERKAGVILNIASDLSVIAPDQRIYRKLGESETLEVKPVTYSVTKHALIGLTKYLATYWAEAGVRVNALSPGGVYNDKIDLEFMKKLTNLIPMARMAQPDEYKGAVIFLLSDASQYMTGANVVMDGGRSVW